MTEPSTSLASQAVLVAALGDPARYPHPVGHMEVIETHISWVILTGDYAYKIKKAVDLGFLDFTTLPRREHFCREELRLNRRLAPDWYVDVVPITGSVEAPVIAGAGSAVEWAVRMREFERGTELSRLLATGMVTPALADELADAVAAFHAGCARDTREGGYGAPEAVRGPVRKNLAALERRLADPKMRATLARLRDWSEAEHRRLVATFAARCAEGFVREGHGDLHLGNMALHAGRVLIFDCIEFDPRLRWVDVTSEIAFVVMDLTHRGRSDLARRLLNRYLERTGDYAGLAVLRYYLVYRALVRATVATIRGVQAGAAADAQTRIQGYLELAERFTSTAPLGLFITHGVAGAGKTTATSALLEVVDLIRVRSDVERKRLAGLSAESRSGSAVDAGLYTPDATRRSYGRLRVLAETVLTAGYSVVLDATFLDRGERDACRALARETGAAFRILACRAHPDALRERVVTREQAGQDASEAGLPVLERQLDRATDLTTEESQDAVVIDTSQAIDAGALAAALGIARREQPIDLSS
jgi:aminoglycoside phosphotransferase family enzyme/predicted kinase